ncbi:putative reverse transcriptase domain-containing protein, partial [Tanacetum coccineum]
TMPNTRSRAIMIREAVNELISRRVAEALEARDAARNLKPLAEGRDEQGGENGNDYEGRNGGVNGNGNDDGNGGGNDNGNGNGDGNGNGGGNGYENHNFEKMETVFHISNYPQKNQVKYATCTLLDNALTWWNTHKRMIRIEAEYAMTWTELMKLMTEVYFPRNEIKKIETELWNLTVKGNDLTSYTRRFQELVLLCTRMVPDEEEKVERFIRDQKLKGYARSAENKRRFDNNPRDNRGQQLVFKRQTVRGKNVARAYTAGNNKKKGYVGSLPYCNKCKLHYEGPCTVRCGNSKRVGHMARDCTAAVALNTQRAPVGNQSGITRNKTRNNEASTKAYAIEGGGANPDSNVVTGTFLLSNCYASMLFDSGANRSFMSSTFSALLDVVPSTLDTSYVVELAARRILETNVILRGCTLGLLGHPFDIDLMPVELGSFNVIIGMDWLARYHAVIVCDEKIVCIPYGDETLIIRGVDYDSETQVTSMKTKDKSEENRLEDVPIVWEFSKVFLEDLPGLPPA